MIQYQNNNKQITFSVKVWHFNTIQLRGILFIHLRDQIVRAGIQ